MEIDQARDVMRRLLGRAAIGAHPGMYSPTQPRWNIAIGLTGDPVPAQARLDWTADGQVRLDLTTAFAGETARQR